MNPSTFRWASAFVGLSVAFAGCTPGDEVAPTPSGPALVATAVPADPTPDPSEPSETTPLDELVLSLEEVANGLDAPVQVVGDPRSGRRFVVEQSGRLRALEGGLPIFLDLGDDLSTGGERGFLGAAFSPVDHERPRVYSHSSGRDGETVLKAWDLVNGEVDVDSGQVIFTHPQPAANHNGGTVTFDPDGMLVLALGDGGGANDRFGQAQDTNTPLGALLRLDVDVDDGYAIPDDNPFVDGGGLAEVWAYGLRNPYRLSYSVAADGSDVLVIADVGQNRVEEVDLVASTAAGVNYGWPIREGTDCFASTPCEVDGLTDPVAQYTHDDGCSIIGGAAYEGPVTSLRGHWFYGDFCTGIVRSVRLLDAARVNDERDWTDVLGAQPQLTSIDALDGTLWFSRGDGTVQRLVIDAG